MDLKERLTADGIELDDKFYKFVSRYKEHLFKWNKIHNLTGATTYEKMDEFIYDAVYPIKFLPQRATLLDIGTGAGFPGLILAFALPGTQVTLAEPLSKRASFLQYIKADFKLSNVTVKNMRVEQMEPQTFDIVTSRAVTDTELLLSLSAPYIDEKSLLLFYKGERVFDEVHEDLNYEIIETNRRHYLLIKDMK